MKRTAALPPNRTDHADQEFRIGGDIVVDPAMPDADVTITLNAAAFKWASQRDGDVSKPKFLYVDR